jgi:hypothetical protein
MTKTHTFASWAEAHTLMGAAYKAGKFSAWCPVNAFGRVTARILVNKHWSKLTEADFVALVAGKDNGTETRKELIRALGIVQNHPFYRHQDILTITGCEMTDEQVRNHLDGCIRGIGKFWSEAA